MDLSIKKINSYVKKLYVEYTKKHFKLYAPFEELNEFINIYLGIKNGKPVIFNTLYKKYRNEGFNKNEAAKKSLYIVDEFLSGCEIAGRGVFKIKIYPDFKINKNKDVKKRIGEKVGKTIGIKTTNGTTRRRNNKGVITRRADLESRNKKK